MLSHLFAAAFGVLVAQAADLPNANLPGNSASLPNSNLPGSPATDQPIMLPNTDEGGWTVTARQEQRAQQAQQQKLDTFVDQTADWQQQTRQLAAKALEEAAKADANSAEAKQLQQQQLELLQQQQAQKASASQQQP